jgi:FkbM family methyltransferase
MRYGLFSALEWMRWSSVVFWWRNDLADSDAMLTEFVLRCAPQLARLRRVPVLGGLLHWASTKTVPRDSLAWVRVSKGLGAGLWLRVNPRTGGHILGGSSEPAVQEALHAQLRPGMTFYDLGANIGFFSLIGARLVGATGKVFSFEADPELAKRLRENAWRNKLAWITVEEKAVWAETGSVAFARADTAESPDRGLGFVANGSTSNTIQVEAVSLDDYVRGCSPPDFIKCDVEGAEVEVLRGARQLLQGKRPVILCEIHSEENRQILIRELSEAAYQCEPCDENHVLALPR